MTLPTTIDLPSIEDKEEEDTNKYLKNLVNEIEDMYEDLAENTNGFIRNNADTDQSQWKPTLNGIVAGTFTYTRQVGWSIRQGIYTEVFADIAWSATTATGNLYLELPYKVTRSDGMPFVGTVQPSSIAFGAGKTNLVINAIPDTYRGEIWSIGSGAATANLAVTASGRLIIYLKYIGTEEE